MSLAVIHSRALAGINAPDVSIEVHISGGLPSLSIVGLPELAVRESKDRVRAAILNSRFEFPNRRFRFPTGNWQGPFANFDFRLATAGSR